MEGNVITDATQVVFRESGGGHADFTFNFGVAKVSGHVRACAIPDQVRKNNGIVVVANDLEIHHWSFVGEQLNKFFVLHEKAPFTEIEQPVINSVRLSLRPSEAEFISGIISACTPDKDEKLRSLLNACETLAIEPLRKALYGWMAESVIDTIHAYDSVEDGAEAVRKVLGIEDDWTDAEKAIIKADTDGW